MSVHELNRAVHHIYIHREKALAFRGGDDTILDTFDLAAQERDALRARDFPALWALHVHPVLLFHLAAILHPREWYLQEVVPKIQGVPNHWYDFYKSPSTGIAAAV